MLKFKDIPITYSYNGATLSDHSLMWWIDNFLLAGVKIEVTEIAI